MSNRFENDEIKVFRISDKMFNFISIAIFFALIIIFFLAVDATGRSSIRKQQDALESAISRDIVQCYAIEGRYPPSLDYLKQHYGLVYDENTFFVDYMPIAANLYPDVTVILINK